jgi:hypothetical protein
MRNGPGPPGLQPSQRQREHTLYSELPGELASSRAPHPMKMLLLRFRTASEESFEGFILIECEIESNKPTLSAVVELDR